MTSHNSPPQRSQLLSNYLHCEDQRTPREKMLSNQVATHLSQLNISRIRQVDFSSFEDDLKDQYHFICMAGLPPFEDEFGELQLPGSRTTIVFSGFEKEYSEEEYVEIFKGQCLERQANNLRKAVLDSPKDKKIIVVYHSFGSFAVGTYFDIYPDHRISGIIDVGGAPITFYPFLLQLIPQCLPVSDEALLKSVDLTQKLYEQQMKQSYINPIKNKYLTISFLKMVKDSHFINMFEKLRNLPKVLKLITYGYRDPLFIGELLNQKFVHYSYVNKLDAQYEGKGLAAYKHLYNREVKNLQEKFCINFELGKHSIHKQPKVLPDLRKAVRQYLWILSKMA